LIQAGLKSQQFLMTLLDTPGLLGKGGLPIATGENMRTIWEFQQMITIGRIAFPEPDVMNCGGVTPFMKIAHLAEVHNLPVTSHGA
jgi:L-alanine-DL-glutamate epimerase-like enolase superfamily enzyme